ncbi:hypothetical protein SUGI_1107710 [Cryptomeria japonica]|nr:hypothetical protein SUGI_1107710 [Cryptomeria japonica]
MMEHEMEELKQCNKEPSRFEFKEGEVFNKLMQGSRWKDFHHMERITFYKDIKMLQHEENHKEGIPKE